MTIRVAVIGHRGWIGSQIVSYLRSHTSVDVVVDDSLRIHHPVDVESFLEKEKPTHVLCVVGRTHGKGFPTIDYLEQPGTLDENIRDNLYAPLLLSTLSTTYQYHFTYIGTGCIYDIENPLEYSFTEADTPNFFGSSYSIVKGYTDLLMRNLPNTLCLRIRLPTTDTHHPRNLITKLVHYQQIQSIPNSISVLPTLLPYLYDMMVHSYTGVVNFVNPGGITHEEILTMYRDHVDASITWKNISAEEMKQRVCVKRCNNVLDTSHLEMLYPEVPSAKEAVMTCIQQMKNFNLTL